MIEMPHPEILEIGPRAVRGATQPFRCVADDGHTYFVKSQGAHWRSLVCEWLAGRMAQLHGLPIAPFKQVSLPDELINALRPALRSEVVSGFAFGSQVIHGVREFEPALLGACVPEFRRDLVAFDWWVRNADRTLGILSGNPNLLWDTAAGLPVVIDHNLAFDPEFDAAAFRQTHIFRLDFEQICADLVMRQHYQDRFSTFSQELPALWSEIPHNWIFDESGQSRFELSEFMNCLHRASSDDFWHN